MMQLEIISFDGSTIINDGINFRGSIPEGGAGGLSLQPPEASFAARTGQFPKLAAMRGREKYLAMKFEVLDQSQMLAKRDVLAGIFDASETSGELKTLVVSDGGSEWQLEGVVVGFSFDAALGSATVVFAAPDPVWRSVIQNTDTWNITASGQTRSISTEGNTTALPYFEIKPTGVRSGNGMSYRRFVEVINPMRHNFRGALNLANGEISNGLDTAALTTAKMQADGDDLQVRVDGQNCDRWLQDMDTGSTEIWIRLNLKAGISVSLGAAIPASGEISMIELEDTPANMNRIKRMPQAGQVRVGSEYFCYQGKDVQELKLLDIKRSAFGSAKAAHSTGETVIWIEHRIWLVYGDPDAGPANSEEAANLQPVFRLDSENERLDFDVFSTENGGRQGEWEGQLKFRRPAGRTATGEPGETTLYSASAESNADNPDWSDPGTHLGQQLRPVREGAEYLRTRASLWWSFYHPAGITAVTVSGRKFAADCSHWPRVELLYSSNGSDWQVKWSEPVPSAAGVWEDFTINAVPQPLGGSWRHIALVMRGVMPGGSSEARALVEYSDVEVLINPENVPKPSIGGEHASQYEFKKAVLRNDTTGEALILKNLSVGVGQSVVVDCQNREIYLSEDGANLRASMHTNTIRERWISLAGGKENILRYTDAGTGDVTITTKYFGRKN